MLQLRRAGLLCLLLTLLSVPISAAHAQYPPTTPPNLVVTPQTGPPGYPVVLTVSNCIPNEEVIFTLNGQQYSTTCNPVTLQATVTPQAPLDTGSYEVCAIFMGPPAVTQGFRSGVLAQATPRLTICDSIDVVAQSLPTTTTTVPPAGPSTTMAGSIPTTGSSGIDSTSSIAIVLLVVGAGMLIVARIRRRKPAPTT